jgi:hypothetical protein
LTRKTAVLVGNGKLESDLSAVVDNAQFMMRFNEPSLADDMSGSRTDMLMLAASSTALPQRLANLAFLENAALKSSKMLMLAYYPEITRKCHPWPNILQRLTAEGAIGRCKRSSARVLPTRRSVSRCAIPCWPLHGARACPIPDAQGHSERRLPRHLLCIRKLYPNGMRNYAV